MIQKREELPSLCTIQLYVTIVSIKGLNCLQDEKNIIAILCRIKSKEEIRLRHLKVLDRGEDYDAGVIKRRVFVLGLTL